MAALFRAIATDNPERVRGLFFPEAAYVTMKTGRIPAPASDWTDRLWAFFVLDVGAYHRQLLGHGAAHFVRVVVNPAYANWIPTGVCENGYGYWHEPGVRLVYVQRGVVRSFAVDSLISWHNTWFVVHLGPNPRPLNVGTVDDPALGPGVAGPAGGC
jgi:hypothetical protein